MPPSQLLVRAVAVAGGAGWIQAVAVPEAHDVPRARGAHRPNNKKEVRALHLFPFFPVYLFISSFTLSLCSEKFGM
jgi:hypothetical protein